MWKEDVYFVRISKRVNSQDPKDPHVCILKRQCQEGAVIILLIARLVPEEDVPVVLNLGDMDWLPFIHDCKAEEKQQENERKTQREASD